MTLRLGLIGYPIAHSLSPRLHQGWIRAAGLDATYALFEVDPHTDADALIDLLDREGLAGANLTVPLKRRILPRLARMGPTAKLCGAVNTVVREETGWAGFNTDADGFLDCLPDGAPKTVIVLGAGGAARAVVAGLARAGSHSLTILNRTRTRGQHCADALAKHFPHARFRVGDLDAFSECAPDADLVVNAISGPGLPRVAMLPLDTLARHAVWVDLNYWLDTPTLGAELATRGHRIIDGLPMLVHQGARAFTHFTGHAADPQVAFDDLASGCGT